MNKRDVLEKAKQLASTALLLFLVFTVIVQQAEIQKLNQKISQASPVQAIQTLSTELNLSQYRYHGNPFVTSLWPGQIQAENITFWHMYQWTQSGLVNKTDVLTYPEQEASYIIFTDGTYYYAKNGLTGKIDYAGTDASTVIQNAVNALASGGKILIKTGTYTLSNTIYVEPGVVVEGEGKDATILNAPSGKPAFAYIQPSGTGVVFAPLVLKNLKIVLPSSGGPHYGVKVDCSAYGCTRLLIDNVEINGYFASGSYDKNSNTPHIGIDLINVWDYTIQNSNILLPGICLRVTDYGWLIRDYFDRGAYGNAYAVMENSGHAEVFLDNCVTEKGAVTFASSTSVIRYHIKNCHIEGGGWDNPSSSPAILLNYPSGTWTAYIDIEGQYALSMLINYTYRRPLEWLKISEDITPKMLKGFQYTVVSGSPTITWNDWGITIAAGSSDAVVDLWTQQYNHIEVLVGGYLKGVGEARFIDSSLSNYVAIGIDTSKNLYLKQVSGTSYNETQTVDSGSSEYEIIGFIALDMPTKNVVYWKNQVVQSKNISFSRALTLWGCTRVRIYVPAGQTLTFYPRFYTRQP